MEDGGGSTTAPNAPLGMPGCQFTFLASVDVGGTPGRSAEAALHRLPRFDRAHSQESVASPRTMITAFGDPEQFAMVKKCRTKKEAIDLCTEMIHTSVVEHGLGDYREGGTGNPPPPHAFQLPKNKI